MLPKGVIEILTVLEKGPRRFSQLATTRVGSKAINRRTLASRLKMLEREGLVERELKDTWPPTAEYSLTSRGRSVLQLFKEQ